MKIYTKTGDAGQTSLFSGERVGKDDLRIRTYGGVDELNSVLAVVLAQPDVPAETSAALLRIQAELFHLGGELATRGGKKKLPDLINSGHVLKLEQEMDAMDAELPRLKNFILPGGTPSSAFLHLARAVSRRAERDLVQLHSVEPQRAEVLQYVNRLSDYFFMAARFVNHRAGRPESVWSGK